MGYLWDAEKTDLLIDCDGWVHSGDLGRTDKEGFFYVTGRIKVGLCLLLLLSPLILHSRGRDYIDLLY